MPKEAAFEASCTCVMRVYVRDRSFSSILLVLAFVARLATLNERFVLPDRWTTSHTMLLLACTRVTADQKHVTFVTNANRFRRTRQGCGVVATGMTKDFAAVSTMVLQQTQINSN